MKTAARVASLVVLTVLAATLPAAAEVGYLDEGTVVAWGRNQEGQCNVPAGLADVTQVAGGGWHSLALKADGSVVAWGYNDDGQCNVPAGTYTQVAGGGWHSLALKADGSVAAWGRNDYGQCSVPAGLAGVTQVDGGYLHSLALKTDGSVAAWGDNRYGQCTAPAGLADVTQVAAGYLHSLALKADGSVAAWGENGSGQCNVPAGYFLAVAAGGYHSLGLKARETYEDLLVTGTGARALLQRSITVSGDATIETVMTITNNATMTVGGHVRVVSGGRVTLDGESIAATSFELYGGGFVSGHGTVDAQFSCSDAAAALTADGGTLTVGKADSYAGFAMPNGVIVVDPGATLILLTKGFVSLPARFTLDSGTLAAPNGVLVQAGFNLPACGAVAGRVSADFGSTIEATGPLSLGDADAYDGFYSDGSLLTGAHTVTLYDRNEAVLGSLTELGDGASGGTLTAGAADPSDTFAHFLLEQGKNMVGRGQVNGNTKNHGHVVGDGTGLDERIVFDAPWTVTGKGTFENTLILGTFAPGESPAIASGANQGFGGTVQVELGGTTPGFGNDHHDQIADDGTILLLFSSPTLEILPWNDFVPAVGDEFVVMTWQEGLDGAFGDVVTDPWFTARGLSFDLRYENVDGPGSLTLEAVPEPATLVLVALGAAGALLRRRRG